jgi:hypothetical protein
MFDDFMLAVDGEASRRQTHYQDTINHFGQIRERLDQLQQSLESDKQI